MYSYPFKFIKNIYFWGKSKAQKKLRAFFYNKIYNTSSYPEKTVALGHFLI